MAAKEGFGGGGGGGGVREKSISNYFQQQKERKKIHKIPPGLLITSEEAINFEIFNYRLFGT